MFLHKTIPYLFKFSMPLPKPSEHKFYSLESCDFKYKLVLNPSAKSLQDIPLSRTPLWSSHTCMRKQYLKRDSFRKVTEAKVFVLVYVCVRGGVRYDCIQGVYTLATVRFAHQV